MSSAAHGLQYVRGKLVKFRRLLAIVALSVAGLGLTASPALAAYNGTGGASQSATTVAPGGSVTFVTQPIFTPGASVTVSVVDSAGKVTFFATDTADANGAVTTSVTFTKSGTFKIQVSDGAATATSDAITVTGGTTVPAVANNGSGGALPFTGSSIVAPGLGLGFGLVLVGVGVVAFSRRRQGANV